MKRIHIPSILFGTGWIIAGISMFLQPPNQWLFIGGLTVANIGGFLSIMDWGEHIDIDTESGDIRLKLSEEEDNDKDSV